LWEVLSSLASIRAERAAAVAGRLAALECDANTADERLKRLHQLSDRRAEV
jgi:hypothetical protein